MKTHVSVCQEDRAASAPAPSALKGPKEILVPVDFSNSSVKALRHAARMAGQEKARLIVLHVVEELRFYRTLEMPQGLHQVQRNRAARLEELVHREIAQDIRTLTVVSEGDPAEEITRMADRKHADLIVVGEDARQGLSRWFHGNTAAEVASSAKCPVMVIKERD